MWLHRRGARVVVLAPRVEPKITQDHIDGRRAERDALDREADRRLLRRRHRDGWSIGHQQLPLEIQSVHVIRMCKRGASTRGFRDLPD
jgi:hypothetical protein